MGFLKNNNFPFKVLTSLLLEGDGYISAPTNISFLRLQCQPADCTTSSTDIQVRYCHTLTLGPVRVPLSCVTLPVWGMSSAGIGGAVDRQDETLRFTPGGKDKQTLKLRGNS